MTRKIGATQISHVIYATDVDLDHPGSLTCFTSITSITSITYLATGGGQSALGILRDAGLALHASSQK